MKRLALILVAVAAVALTLVPRTRSAPQAPQIPDDVMREAQRKSQEYRQTAIRLNGLAGAIHSEQDARAFVDALGKAFSEEVPYELTAPLRERVAHAEFVAVIDSSTLIPEQRVADAWNKWVDDIDAPKDARLSVTELHALRVNFHLTATTAATHGYQSLWTLNNIYALKPNGRVADACRPVEALLLLHQIDTMFVNVGYARDFLAQGKSIEDLADAAAKRRQSPTKLVAHAGFSTTPPKGAATQVALSRAEQEYFEKHGEAATSMRVLQLVSQVLGDE